MPKIKLEDVSGKLADLLKGKFEEDLGTSSVFCKTSLHEDDGVKYCLYSVVPWWYDEGSEESWEDILKYEIYKSLGKIVFRNKPGLFRDIYGILQALIYDYFDGKIPKSAGKPDPKYLDIIENLNFDFGDVWEKTLEEIYDYLDSLLWNELVAYLRKEGFTRKEINKMMRWKSGYSTGVPYIEIALETDIDDDCPNLFGIVCPEDEGDQAEGYF